MQHSVRRDCRMTNREKAESLNNKGFALFIEHVNWYVRDKAEWLEEDIEEHLSFWYTIEEEAKY